MINAKIKTARDNDRALRKVACDQDFQAFIHANQAYLKTLHIDRLREKAFTRLEKADHTYLDYTGASLYSEVLVERSAARLRDLILANPHSHSEASVKASNLVETAREDVLDFFKADPEVYEVIFTANASNAIRLVAEAFPFTADSTLLLSVDNHNSMLGMRNFATRQGAAVRMADIDPAEMTLQRDALEQALKEKTAGASLFAYPGQSNFTGVKHELAWLEKAKQAGWMTLLDAAAFAPTNPLDLSAIQPDFLCLSFYKMFGYPTGIGCLIAKKSALAKLNRPWFSGGSVLSVSAKSSHERLAPGSAGFEDGTVNFCLIPAVSDGLSMLREVGMETIRTRCQALSGWFLDAVKKLQHANGTPLLTLYGPDTLEGRGATFAFRLQDAKGRDWNPGAFEALCSEENMSIRTGYHCNPGCNEVVEGLSTETIDALFAPDLAIEDMLWQQQEALPGVIRVSFGLVSNFDDAWRFIRFLDSLLDQDAVV